ncbi:hypothetical protein KIL84_004594 [Mauremys mutica]|uniref:Uncharacterized protein n=1 Tax=Mauremys mutica TaxID=74926 RepID=A0A9D4B061_9SAUR|nr:hypothetical protein KIL84_004594 [Mauremys mutica]
MLLFYKLCSFLGSMPYCLNLYLFLTYRLHLPPYSQRSSWTKGQKERILDVMQKQTALLENTLEISSQPAPQPSRLLQPVENTGYRESPFAPPKAGPACTIPPTKTKRTISNYTFL